MFYELREIEGVEKKPATRELINWIRALQADPDFSHGSLINGEMPYLGVLFKKSQDYSEIARRQAEAAFLSYGDNHVHRFFLSAQRRLACR